MTERTHACSQFLNYRGEVIEVHQLATSYFMEADHGGTERFMGRVGASAME